VWTFLCRSKENGLSLGRRYESIDRYNSDPTMKFCFDFIVIDGNKKTHKDIGEKNEDYYAYGQEVFSPADGTVTDVIDGVRDNIPGINNPYSKLGNAVYIQHSDYEVSILAHLKPGSIKVRPGDKVKRGDPVGLCGNSGDLFCPIFSITFRIALLCSMVQALNVNLKNND
jgi:hypothetical protein